MPCIFIVLGLATPRLAIVLLALLTQWFSGLFDTMLWPILGFVFLPTTLLWFTAVQRWFGGEWTLFPAIGIVMALLIDLSPAGGRAVRRR